MIVAVYATQNVSDMLNKGYRTNILTLTFQAIN